MGRKFSVPYNNLDPEEYLKAIEKYDPYIDHLYFGLPEIGCNYHDFRNFSLKFSDIVEANNNTYEFLKLTHGKYKRFLTINQASPFKNNMDRFNTLFKVLNLIDYNGLEGVIVTDLLFAKHLHEQRPYVELCTSCNSWIWDKRTMDIWSKIGATMFNPPRDALKRPSMLEYFRNTGYKLKYLTNESCMFGCVQQVLHASSVSAGYENSITCFTTTKSDYIKGMYVLPRWLPKLDPYVDIYKLSGRMMKTPFIERTLQVYIDEDDDAYLSEFIIGNNRSKDLKIKAKDIPDKMLTCECRDCDTCKLCDKVMHDHLPNFEIRM